MKPASVADYREAARRRLPRVLFDYIDGGAYAEETLAANVGDLQDRDRSLVGMHRRPGCYLRASAFICG